MNIVVLGASGQIGLPILEKLASSFPERMIIGTSRTGKISLSQSYPNIQILRFDPFSDDWNVLGQPHVIINSIGQIQESPAFTFERVHKGITQKILANRKRLGNPRIIQISALGAGQHPDVSFLHTKALADSLLLTQPNTYVVRPSIVCTPNTMLVKKFKILYDISKVALGKLLVPKGFANTKIQPIAIQDLAEVLASCCTHENPPRIIHAVGPTTMSFHEIIMLMAEVNQHKIRLMEVPRNIVESFVKYFVCTWLPNVINYDQFQLLFRDNIAESYEVESLLGRSPKETKGFWKAQLAFSSSQ